MTPGVWVKAAAVLLGGALVGGGVAAVFSDGDVRASGPVAAAWVDEPLHASVHPMGPIEVTVHATDVDTVVGVTVTMDGETIADIDVSDPDTLVWETLEWTPDAPGVHQIEVVGRDPSGDRGVPGIASFSVVGGDTADTEEVASPRRPDGSSTTTTSTTSPPESITTSSVPIAPTTPSASIAPPTPVAPPSSAAPVSSSTSSPPTSPTTTACQPSTPTVTGATIQSIDSSGADVRVTWSYAGCAPDGFRITVSSPTEPTMTKTVGTASREALFALPTCTQYTVRVRALGAVDSPQSAPFGFQTDCG